MNDSIFTKIIKREIPSEIIYEDDFVAAFKDISPQAPIHYLIVPKQPIPTLNELEDTDSELIGRVVIVASKLAKMAGISDDGYRLVFNCNEGAGQTVFHIHCHLLGGRRMNWPPG